VTKPRKLNNGGGTGKLTSSAAGVSKHGLFIIDDESLRNPVLRDKVFCPVINGEVKGHGLVPRDRNRYPPAMFDPPRDMPLIPQSKWDEKIAEQDREEASLEHVRNRSGPGGAMIPALDQDGQGYCWAYSTTMAVMLLRAVGNQPYVRLSAHAIGCKMKNFADIGGWCGLSAKFHREQGCPSVQFWTEKSMSRSNDKPEVWANAALHKVTEEWADLTRDVYDQNLTAEQVATCLLSGIPVAVDYNEWSHSICAFRLVRVEAGSYSPKILNSWTNQWGENGTGIIRASWDIDGAVALRVTGASPN
jgi:hypothetical protein